MIALGSANLDCRQDGANSDPKNRAGYLFNTTIAGIEQADACLLIGTNRAGRRRRQRRLRKRHLAGRFRSRRSARRSTDLPGDAARLGPEVLDDLAGANHSWNEVLKAARSRC